LVKRPRIAEAKKKDPREPILIQNIQNRDSAAIHLKLNEIIRSTHGAHNAMLGLENLDTPDLEKLRALYQELAEKARRGKTGESSDIGTPDVTAA